MERHPVKSSQIAAIGYDEASRTLEVEFLNGSVYQYDGLPPETFQALIQAGSVGAALRRLVKGEYAFRKM